MMHTIRFANRDEAGRLLAGQRDPYSGRADVTVLALPRGGVPVGFQIAWRLAAPLDVLIVRKIGVPFQPELAMGGVASGGVRVLNLDVIESAGVQQSEVDDAAVKALQEVERRERAYRGNRPPLNVRDRTIILVDDGLATGATMRAAIEAVRKLGAAEVVVAVPVAAASTARIIEREADALVCLSEPDPFYAIGFWYADFAQLEEEEEVRALLAEAWSDSTAGTGHAVGLSPSVDRASP